MLIRTYCFALFAASFLLLSGCVTGTAVQTGEHTYPAVANWQGIKILFEKPTRPYKIIGPVSALGAPAAEERAVYDMLKQQAAKLGADAVLVGNPGSNAYVDGFRTERKTLGWPSSSRGQRRGESST